MVMVVGVIHNLIFGLVEFRLGIVRIVTISRASLVLKEQRLYMSMQYPKM